jgi:hypothetical protein
MLRCCPFALLLVAAACDPDAPRGGPRPPPPAPTTTTPVARYLQFDAGTFDEEPGMDLLVSTDDGAMSLFFNAGY